MNTLQALNWRYATKKFDPTKKIEASKIDKLKEAIQLTATSYGLQAFKVFAIQSQEVKEKLLAASYNQSQIVDADTVFVFANYTKVENADVDKYVKLIADTRDLSTDDLKGFGDYMKGAIGNISDDVKPIWTSKQTYIALGSLLIAAGELEIDSCPMEGFEADKYNEILGLNDLNLNASVIATVGYRAEDDQSQHAKKVRKSINDLFTTI